MAFFCHPKEDKIYDEIMDQTEVTVIKNSRHLFSCTWTELWIWQPCWNGDVKRGYQKSHGFWSAQGRNSTEICSYLILCIHERRRVIRNMWIGKIKYHLLQQEILLCLKQDILYSNSNSVYKAEFIIFFSLSSRAIEKALILQ